MDIPANVHRYRRAETEQSAARLFALPGFAWRAADIRRAIADAWRCQVLSDPFSVPFADKPYPSLYMVMGLALRAANAATDVELVRLEGRRLLPAPPTAFSTHLGEVARLLHGRRLHAADDPRCVLGGLCPCLAAGET